MCGITGYHFASSRSREEHFHLLRSMSSTLVHRGPDSYGEWCDEKLGLGLAHRRLSIQDISASGNQPMESEGGRYTIVYNGEIYNFLELRKELEQLGHKFRGGSDTEVMLAVFEKWGVKPGLERFNGMFAFALWDKRAQRLYLARDRMGEKPLYYGLQGKVFYFSSELKALGKHPEWRPKVDRRAISLLLTHNYIPAPYSIYSGIQKLRPGTMLSYCPATGDMKTEVYWSLQEVLGRAIGTRLALSPDEIASELESRLLGSIQRQMIADVPVGAFLSGGIDSSTVVALMQSLGKSSVRTFTIGFDENNFNEAKFAEKVSKHLGTDHTELYVEPRQALEVIPSLADIYDEPFADSSQIPTFLVSRLAREEVVVSLSGDGGDELFGGYSHYYQTLAKWRALQKYPYLLRKLAAGSFSLLPAPLVNGLLPFFISRFSKRSSSDPAGRLAEITAGWAKNNLQALYLHHLSYWKNGVPVVEAEIPAYVLNDEGLQVDSASDLQDLQFWDMLMYLPDDILTKVDRAAMAVSLETRIPLLDHEIVEFAMRVPSHVNAMHPHGKWPLRRILGKYVPEELFERPKQGFAIPVGQWLRGPLCDWADSLLQENKLEQQGFLNPEVVARTWEAHKLGTRDYSFRLWGILMFQAWLEKSR